ncbi:2-succinyl-5-enolpyruvyl-6-hydroxy-3-cyclohexene-1-carboxylate synthase [Humibacillus xanthopallidus]|uniref:2-succinyl-5-enolpyruvyl-6-hydroxy-3-cyclohexene-1-carboxylate synthase n=1 Tax=Humibacillus xanthopallidus TaxID=412689 RepID=A0A543PMZ4_9MICO|nr:2-succinyl-5-enolpyruvyl-6-hydroxy-3-cyclohexene-1-carboxylic-acid synthase [Humibacillus xanthopallidus]TQN45448.1 2-succinyl-5-enolpyruvyl-6-hydroxy-3-cyclohexene-1-carboxylate synthase [Humibacillus xanthopallidus]
MGDEGSRTAYALALRVVQELWLAGVRDVVLAPGSRSAPLALVLHAADGAGDLRLHVRVDERSAGFLALGLTTGSRRPVAVVTTSGTAVGNLLPAVMEAHHTGRRLVVVSADRPDRLRGAGANQTTEQAGIFGVFAPCHDLTAGDEDARLRAAVTEACTSAGPTQLNLQLDGGLLPPGSDPGTWWTRREDGAHRNDPATADVTRPGDGDPRNDPATADVTRPEDGAHRNDPAMAGLARGDEDRLRLALGPRTVVVAGDGAGPAARLLAEAANWPLVAEPTSGARIGRQAIRTGRLLLTTALRDEVERVVVIGHPTLSRPVTGMLSDPGLEVLAVRGPDGVATDPGRVARVLGAVPTVSGPDDPAWFSAWREADDRLGALIDAGLRTDSPLAVAAVVGRAVVGHATLVVGSSNPVRDLDVMATPWPPLEHRFVVGNRGLAGIDGVVSTAVGVALGRPGASRTIAYLGDLTFLHDTNGLLIGPGEPRPDLTLVVLSDDGGAIFSALEQGDRTYASAFERVFGTPHGTDLEALCAAHHTAYERVTDLSRLGAALDEQPSGIRVLEVPVSRVDRRGEAAWLRDLAQQAVPPL